MITKENFSEEHVRELQKKSKSDPGLIERTLYAFGLLEALERAGLDFIFKGGTSLLLLLPEPKRFSTDIDIVVEPGTEIEDYISEASKTFPFRNMEEQKRAGRNIVKRHFKFTYESPIKKGPLYILLDVLYGENHYKRLTEKDIKSDLLLTDGDNLRVKMPSVDCILGDKMTAFAPHTSGIPLGVGKDLEVIKQFFDVGALIEVCENFDDLKDTYYSVSGAELAFRGNQATSEEALLDTIRAAACIGSRGKSERDDFPFYLRGTRDIVNHIFGGGYSMEVAMLSAPKVIYLATCLLCGKPFLREIPEKPDTLKQEDLTQPELVSLRSFRKRRDNTYDYLVMADNLLKEFRS